MARGFTNTYFCNPDATIVEIFGTDFIVTDFWGLSSCMGLNYFAYLDDEFFKNIHPLPPGANHNHRPKVC